MTKVRIERGSLLIADLSGYTHYLASVDLQAIHVVCELLDTIATALSPYEVVKLEGDAVFCQALDGTVSGEDTLTLISHAYEQFVAHANRINTDSGCTCPACDLLPGLGLKFVLHHGEYAVHDIAGRAELVGSDVIVVHRLLKNAVGTQWGQRDYVLLTEQWANDLGVDLATLGGEQHSEAHEHIGSVKCLILNLSTSDADRVLLKPRTADAQAARCTYVGQADDSRSASPVAAPVSLTRRRS